MSTSQALGIEHPSTKKGIANDIHKPADGAQQENINNKRDDKIQQPINKVREKMPISLINL